jgi:leucyl aminopeptidase
MAMELKVEHGSIEQKRDAAIVVNLFEGVKGPGGATGAVDRALGGSITDLIASGDFKGKFKEAWTLRSAGKITADRVLIVGLGKEEKFTLDRIREVAAKAHNVLRDLRLESFSTIIHGAGLAGYDVHRAAEAVAEGLLLGSYRFDVYKTEKGEEDGKGEVKRVTLVEREVEKVREVEDAVHAAEVICRAVNRTRELVNQPAGYKTPSKLAEVALEVAKEAGLKAHVIDRAEAEKLGMGAFLGVAQGSDQPPKFIVLEYWGAGPEVKPVALVGKGITFDSGGLSLKSADNMMDMKEDMSGAAAVLGTLEAVGRLRLPINVVGIAPCTENMPSGKAIKPGDILRTHLGKTIEVLNTDAEGRLILADGLGYVTRYEPQAIVDLATLTGACMVALGKKTTGMLGTDEELTARIRKAAQAVGEYVWPLPMYEEYEEQIKSDVADVKNIGGRWAGAITAAKLLQKFVKDYPWVHLDIAGTAFTDQGADAVKKEYLGTGATGVGVRLLVQMLRHWEPMPPH